ncbi:toll/interleukin-1 receptor domain-containing protein [Kitasatospora sp. NPDC093679]|uniref:toll/interleukin-1 receptor domain-containing protein n=1 Tax=Kitasatospora sp. NPDC093679 TaxID=3154983 RepID=UPI003419FDBA
MIDFFVSYAEDDLSWAEWIGWQLESAGYSVRLRAWDHALPGTNRVLAEDSDLGNAERLIAVLSPDYRLSADSRAQWSAFLRTDPAGERRRIVPVEVVPGHGGALLGNLEPVSLVGLDRRAAQRALLAAVRETRLKPSRSPGYPGRRAPAYPAGGLAALAPDTRMLLILLGIDGAAFLYGALAYTGRSGDSGDLWRSLVFVLLLVVTLRSTGRWWRRRF